MFSLFSFGCLLGDVALTFFFLLYSFAARTTVYLRQMVFWHDAGNGDERSSSPSLHSLLSMCCWPFSICFLLIYRRRLCAALDEDPPADLGSLLVHRHNVVVVVVRCLLSYRWASVRLFARQLSTLTLYLYPRRRRRWRWNSWLDLSRPTGPGCSSRRSFLDWKSIFPTESSR